MPKPAPRPPVADEAREENTPPPLPEPLKLATVEGCEEKLRELGVRFTVGKAIDGGPGCGIARPFVVGEILPGVPVKPSPSLRCETALALARWLDRSVLPSVKALQNASDAGREIKLAGIGQASGYVCRRRNNSPTGRVSEHAVGSAVDIVEFSFSGRAPIRFGEKHAENAIEAIFLKAARATACLYFTTVLGPGSDAHHDDHLHLDLAVRRGGYRLCQ